MRLNVFAGWDPCKTRNSTTPNANRVALRISSQTLPPLTGITDQLDGFILYKLGKLESQFSGQSSALIDCTLRIKLSSLVCSTYQVYIGT